MSSITMEMKELNTLQLENVSGGVPNGDLAPAMSGLRRRSLVKITKHDLLHSLEEQKEEEYLENN